jgi:hypothetical protein
MPSTVAGYSQRQRNEMCESPSAFAGAGSSSLSDLTRLDIHARIVTTIRSQPGFRA